MITLNSLWFIIYFMCLGIDESAMNVSVIFVQHLVDNILVKVYV